MQLFSVTQAKSSEQTHKRQNNIVEVIINQIRSVNLISKAFASPLCCLFAVVIVFV